jgi:hypothetical protein
MQMDSKRFNLVARLNCPDILGEQVMIVGVYKGSLGQTNEFLAGIPMHGTRCGIGIDHQARCGILDD